jgi:hypothetical protein
VSKERVGLRELLERFPWLTERRVRSMVNERSVPHWKVRQRLLFDPEDFQRMLDEGYVPPASRPQA